jgi:EpsD family peptidyl-prolyl cis-trans isomerase
MGASCVNLRITPVFAIAFAASTVFMLGACGKKDAAPKASATQVAAKVNSSEITVHQVNAVLSRAPNVPAEAAPRAKREVLSRLVDQQLAVEQAIAKKLDRSPEIVQAIELARAEILARAYADSVVRAQAKPSDDEVKKYYNDHPELFAKRRIYSLEEIAVSSKEDIYAQLSDMVAKKRSMGEIGKWLQSKGARIAPNHGTRAAEQIPMGMLAKLQDAKDGEVRVIETPNGATVVRIIASRSAPVDEATADGRIRQFLFNRQAQEAVAADMKALKAAAKIEYMGEFAQDLGAAEAKAKAEAEAKAKSIADAKKQAEAEALERAEAARKAREASEARAREQSQAKTTATKSGSLSDDRLQKGLGGLR